ncbi:Threonine dehydratase [Abeliophyllum distichum]|uniref:Threonine dehydratase n=1 Tax=Abeliophyllum distichum TaxID=126358 RepID=A0ABD1QYK3_9LAMI
MEVLRFVPAQTPLLRSKFTTNDTVKTSSVAIRTRRVKPSINAALAKQAAEILPSVEREPPRAPSAVPLLRVSPSSLQCESGYLIPNNPDNGGVSNGTLNAMEYLTNILVSKVYDVAYESPLQLATKLSERWGFNVLLNTRGDCPG